MNQVSHLNLIIVLRSLTLSSRYLPFFRLRSNRALETASEKYGALMAVYLYMSTYGALSARGLMTTCKMNEIRLCVIIERKSFVNHRSRFIHRGGTPMIKVIGDFVG